ncbi:MAG: hypothetical protein OEZ32_13300 [Nitrospinota bacterium]|nr:hypothetical protein [Nitrospinota bacterium]
MTFAGRNISLLLILTSVLGFIIAGCNSGSGNGSSGAGQTGSLSGVYDIRIEIADISCSDGSVVRKGYGTSGEIVQDGKFLEFKQHGQTIGHGHIQPDGAFHLSATLSDAGFDISAVLDGKVIDNALVGLSHAAWTTDQGLTCRQSSEFTATPTGGA